MQSDLDHIREIEALSRGALPGPARARGAGAGAAMGAGLAGGRDPVVLASWLRCLDKHGLDPAARAQAYILPEAVLREHRQASQDLIAIARSGIDDLYKLVAGQNYVLLLADAGGVTVEYLGDAAQKAALRRSGLYLGAEWSEARAGTCALGACIETGEPLIIHQSDHFDVTHGGLSCTAAPIYDTSGRLAAVLDVSLLASPRARASQVLALNLVRQTARRIEMANLMEESRSDWVLRLADSPDFLDVDPQAAIRLDGAGRVIGMTHGAQRLLARSLGQDWRAGPDLLGRPIQAIFNLDAAGLENLTRQRAPRDRLIETRDGYRLFAHALEPRPPARALPRPLPVAAAAGLGSGAAIGLGARALPRAQALPASLRDWAGADPALLQIAAQAATAALQPFALLIEGASGAGKTRLARSLHGLARRGPLIELDCQALTEDEAEVLFGRGEGRNHRPGLIDAAEAGTLLLENLPELPARLQARLVSLLAEARFRPLGALRERRSGARVIATAHPGAQGLREDLAQRLAGAKLVLPRLAQRRDLLALIAAQLAQGFGQAVPLTPPAAEALARHDWPGNLHELTQLCQSLAASSPPLPLRLDALPPPFHSPPQRPGNDSGKAALLHHLLAEHGWNISAVARRLGVDRTTIHRQMQRQGLSRADRHGPKHRP